VSFRMGTKVKHRGRAEANPARHTEGKRDCVKKILIEQKRKSRKERIRRSSFKGSIREEGGEGNGL